MSDFISFVFVPLLAPKMKKDLLANHKLPMMAFPNRKLAKHL